MRVNTRIASFVSFVGQLSFIYCIASLPIKFIISQVKGDLRIKPAYYNKFLLIICESYFNICNRIANVDLYLAKIR